MKRKRWAGRLAAGLPLAAIAFLLSGCSDVNKGILDPHGTIARQQLDLIIFASILCLVILVPVLIMTFVFAWKYRAKKEDAEYKPNWAHSGKIETVMWGIPILVILIIAIVTSIYTHKLDPHKAIASEKKPITIEVTALDWKWLFTYPDQGIATVNYVEFPAGVPVHFKLTADAPMNSFWIPQLAGQEYVMSGMAMDLNVQADKEGVYPGRGANFSGEHFENMYFDAKAASQEDFDKWVEGIKQASPALTQQGYDELAEQSVIDNYPTYSSFPDGLFDRIVNKYAGGANMSGMNHGMAPAESGDAAQDSSDMSGMDMSSMDMSSAEGVTDAASASTSGANDQASQHE